MAWEDRGYRLSYTETPRLAENLTAQRNETPQQMRDENPNMTREQINAQVSCVEMVDSACSLVNQPPSVTLGDDQAPPCPLAAPAPVVRLPPPEITLVTCPDCGGQHPQSETCFICEKMANIRELARKNRLDYHLKMKGQRAEAEGNV